MKKTSLDSRIKTLERRLQGLTREKIIYNYVLDHVGEKIMKIKLGRMFGYVTYKSVFDSFTKSRIGKYVRQEPTLMGFINIRRFRNSYNRYIRDVIWLPAEVVDEGYGIKTIASLNKRWGHRLCFKETVPFWLLAEYGGPYSGREFIDEINKRIEITEKKLTYLRNK